MEEEIQAHLRMAAEGRRERGDSAEEARTAALREFGNIPLVEDATREVWGWAWLERLLQDLKYALKQLRNFPGFTCAVIGTLALGLGAAAAMFTAVDRVLLRPFPYEDPSRLLDIQEAGKGGATPYGAPVLDIEHWQERSRTLDGIAFFNQGDTPASQPVVVVNRAFVKAYTGEDGDPGKILGETLLSYSKDRRAFVVGVLDDERQVSIAEQSQPEIES